jgi:hypothetical protein
MVASHNLSKESILNLRKLYGATAFFVIASHVNDPSAHGKAPHQPGDAGLQQFGRRADIAHPRIQPQVVAVCIEDDWHAVMHG